MLCSSLWPFLLPAAGACELRGVEEFVGADGVGEVVEQFSMKIR